MPVAVDVPGDTAPAPSLFEITDIVYPHTPLDLYATLRERGYPFLLESVEKSGHRARFSFVGADPVAVVTVKNRKISVRALHHRQEVKEVLAPRLAELADVSERGPILEGDIREGFDSFDALRSAMPCFGQAVPKFDRQVFVGGGMGYLAYDLVEERLGRMSRSDVPDAQFGIFQTAFLFDHLTEKVHLAAVPLLDGDDPREIAARAKEDLLVESSLPKTGPEPEVEVLQAGDVARFEEGVRIAKEHILDGDIFQVVLSRATMVKLQDPDPVQLYMRLRKINPSPYTYIFEFGDLAIVGASPETLFSVYRRKLTVNPIAGTCPRGGSPQEDELLARSMLEDEKERAEHVMLVDLARNDARSVSRSGTVTVEDFMSVIMYSHVQHIETTVRGDLREECDQFDAARAVFPAGTLSGAPKLRALEIIDDLESEGRGIYGGGVGYFSADGSADFAITIRSVLLRDGIALVQAGAGIVADSDPHKEYLETERKMAAMKKALGVAV